MIVFHLSTLKSSKYILIPSIDQEYFLHRMVDEAIIAAIKLKSIDALHFIEAKCQLNEGNSARVRQARERFQDNDDNPLKNVFKIFNRASRPDD